MHFKDVAFTVGIGFLGMLWLTPESALARHGWGCGGGYYGAGYYGGGYYGGGYYGGGYYGGRFYGGGPVDYAPYYSPRATALYGPSAMYGQPTYGQPYPPSAPLYGQANAAGSMYGPAGSAPPARVQPTTMINIAMVDNSFQPTSINVQSGTTVRWTNRGTHIHTITAKDGTWDSGDVRPGATYSATFQHPGTYYLYCRHHEGMEATIVVGRGTGSSMGNGYATPRSPGY